MPSPTSMTIQSGYPFCHLLLKAVWTHSRPPERVSSLVNKALHPSNEGKGDLPPVFESPSEGRLALRFDLQSRGPCLCHSDSDASDAGRAECIWEMTSLEEAGFRWWGVASNLCRPRLPLRPIHLGSLGSKCSWAAFAPGHTQIGNAESTRSLSQAWTGWVCWGKPRAEAPRLSGVPFLLHPLVSSAHLFFSGYLVHNSCPSQPASGVS